MTDKLIFDFFDYKAYLSQKLGGRGRRTGLRKALSNHLQIQTSFLSQVLNGDQNLSLEQAFSTNEFLDHSPDEREWFLLLVQIERAGTYQLKKYFEDQLRALQEKRLQFKNRLSTNLTISEQDKSTYYSHWSYLAIHMLVSIPEFQTRASIREHLKLEEDDLDRALAFLSQKGIIHFDGKSYSIGNVQVHLGSDNENIQKHHTNWRLQALKALDNRDPKHLHYSVAYTLSEKDVIKIKDKIIELVKENLKVIAPSKEEVLYCNVIDFFEVKPR